MCGKRHGFTIVELMMVIAIISVLITLVVSVSSGAMKSARSQRAAALCSSLEGALSVYYTQKGRWPGPVGDRVYSGQITGTAETYELTGEEVRQTVRAIVEQSKKGNPLMDISGLFVSRSSGESGTTGTGLDFIPAVRGTKQHPKRMTLSQMYFGYPDADTGYFRRFRIVYSSGADEMTVSQQ